jgi:LCP family protein required for cell wall assembly
VAVVAATVGATGALYVERRDAAIDRVDVVTEPSLDGATNVLLVGTDAGPDREGVRADTIAVVRVEPDGAVRVLSVPPHLVDPTTGQRLNSVWGTGRQAFLDALDRVTGIPIDHFVEVDFPGFVALVDELGGLELAVDVPLRDDNAGLDLQPSPCTTLDGETALAVVRARHVDGDIGDPNRMARARGVLAAAVAQLGDVDPGPAELDRLSRVAADHLVVDDGLSLDRMVALGRAIAGGAGTVETVTVPLLFDPADGSGILPAPHASSVYERFGAPPGSGPGPGDGGQPIPDVVAGIRPC